MYAYQEMGWGFKGSQNISVISWLPVSLVEETRIPSENDRQQLYERVIVVKCQVNNFATLSWMNMDKLDHYESECGLEFGGNKPFKIWSGPKLVNICYNT
jgi:hypothetical protein